jgi:hypothetical protein
VIAAAQNINMKTALFTNFTDKPFTGFWNGKGRTFLAGEKKFMPEYLARHFAKHLANQVLTANGQDTACSPKKPEEVPAFMNEFNKAFQIQAGSDEDDDLDVAIDLANKPASEIPEVKKPRVNPYSPELKTRTDDDDDDYSDPDKE